jgi:hypothetical protein
MPFPSLVRQALTVALSLSLSAAAVPNLEAAQFGKRLLQIGACGAGAYGGAKLGEKVAEMEAKRQNLSPAEAAKRKRAFEIGFALALCGGGAMIAGTSYSKLSKRGQQAREKEILAALDDAKPHAYADPDNAALQGTATPQAAFMDGDQECRIVEDHLAADTALVKYCRNANGMWMVKAV